jgi:hypothetical protein
MNSDGRSNLNVPLMDQAVWLGREDSNLDMVDWDQTVEIGPSPIREKRSNHFPSTLISCSKRSNFENRTEAVESRGLEKSEPFGEK